MNGSHDHELRWFCVRSQSGRQNVAAAHLRSFEVEVFNPHMRRRKATRLGVLWRSEALFPNYLFARFVLAEHHRRIRYAFGVKDLVRFGEVPRIVADREVDNLRELWGPAEEYTVPQEIRQGMQVALSGRLFCGYEAEVLCVLPARQRIKVLLDFIGGPTQTEVALDEVTPVLPLPVSRVVNG